MFSKLPLFFTLFCTLAITGCNDDDPVNDRGIDAVIEFDIDDYTQVTSSANLAGVWVAVGTGTFERDKGGDRKYGEQSALIYFVITGSLGSYRYANCFDVGRLEDGFGRGGFDTLIVDGNSIEFDSENSAGDLLSDDDDDGIENIGTITDNAEINTVFTYNVGGSKEVNTFQMRKVSNDDGTIVYLGDSTFKETDEVDKDDQAACFAQWSGSYSTSDGYYTVERFDASFETDVDPFTASEFMSDAEDISEYSTLLYDKDNSVSTKNSDSVNFFYSGRTFHFGIETLDSGIDQSGIINIGHVNLK